MIWRMSYLTSRIAALALETGVLQEILPNGLGTVLLNYLPPARVARLQFLGFPNRPRIGVAAIVGHEGVPNRRISVTVPFSDGRAENFLTHEARQLPTNCPGLLMFEVSQSSGAIETWEPLLSSVSDRPSTPA